MSGSPDVGMSIAIGMVRHNKAKKLLFNILEIKLTTGGINYERRIYYQKNFKK